MRRIIILVYNIRPPTVRYIAGKEKEISRLEGLFNLTSWRLSFLSHGREAPRSELGVGSPHSLRKAVTDEFFRLKLS